MSEVVPCPRGHDRMCMGFPHNVGVADSMSRKLSLSNTVLPSFHMFEMSTVSREMVSGRLITAFLQDRLSDVRGSIRWVHIKILFSDKYIPTCHSQLPRRWRPCLVLCHGNGNGNGISRRVTSHDETGSALQQKKTAQWTLSARRELQSHPLAGQAQACGRLAKGAWARGPDGTYRDHWCSHCKKKLSHASSLWLGAMLMFQYRSTGDPRIVRVILAPQPCNFHRIRRVNKLQETRGALRPCCINPVLELCVSSLHRGHVKCDKSLTCHQNRVHATLLLQKNIM